MDINSYISDLPDVEDATFEEYVKIMELYVLTAKKSDSFEGTKKLLTELYPDNAHFIYELLQNAEDANAEKITFKLTKDSLCFIHNGTHQFTLKDVKGITSIGNSTKKEDHTKVGKFGVGFKSVFAFTLTPRIYSDDYNFEIHDMLLPCKIPGKDERSSQQTYFEFPFKGDAKEKQKYFDQIKLELSRINENTIMFLDHVKTIEYFVDNVFSGAITKNEITENIFDIKIEPTKVNTQWLIYEKPLSEENLGNSKLHVNIAYKLNKLDSKWKIVPTDGTVNIFFPAVSEHSGFKFNLNGPFASTIARDSVRDCEENKIIYEKLYELIKESINQIYINSKIDSTYCLYEVMPNNEDVLNGEYFNIYEKLISFFNENKVIYDVSGKLNYVSNLIRTPASIQDLFSFNELKEILKFKEENWCCGVPARNKRVRDFFSSLDIRNFSYKTFSKLFEKENRNNFEILISRKDIYWFKKFYLILIDMNNHFVEQNMGLYHANYLKNLRDSKIIWTAINQIEKPINVYLCHKEQYFESNIIIHEMFIFANEYRSLWNILNIDFLDEKVTLKQAIKRIKENNKINDAYFNDLLLLANNVSELKAEDLNELNFLYSDDTNKKYQAKELYLDLPYEKTGYANIANYLGTIKPLATLYKTHYSESQIKSVIEFLKSLGINYSIKVTNSDVKKNPLYQGTLYKYSDNVTALSTGEDFSISGLEDLLKSNVPVIAQLIWNYLIKLDSIPRYCKASFSPNRTTPPRKCDSTLIQMLKDFEWLPNKNDSRFYKPMDINFDDLPEEFDKDENSIFPSLILFGCNKNKVSIQSEQLISDWGVDKNSDQANALRALLTNPQIANQILNIVKSKEKETVNLSQAISNQSRSQLDVDTDEDDYDQSIRNVERRGQKINEELEEGIKKSPTLAKIGIVNRAKANPDERIFLYGQYHGKCQICDKAIIKWNGDRYFEGINLISTHKLMNNIVSTVDLGWNSISLCPNHAAIYKYGAIDLSGIQESILNTKIESNSSNMIKLPIKLQGEVVEIKYTPKHFLALQKAFIFFGGNNEEF